MSTFSHHSTSALIGMAIFLSGLQFSIGSVEMSSKYSVENFSKDQATLNAAASALSTYVIIGLFWTLATCLVLYADYGAKGIIWGLITNGLFMAWLIVSYMFTFKKVAKNMNLKMPKLFDFSYSPSPLPRKINPS